MHRSATVTTSFVLVSLISPRAAAQLPPSGFALELLPTGSWTLTSPLPAANVPGCAADGVWTTAADAPGLATYLDAQARQSLKAGLLAAGTEHREHHFRDAELHARRALEREPGHLEARYHLAAALALLTQTAGLRAQIPLGQEAYDHARAVLAVDPDHAGAHHILGRFHADIMRMGTVTRFLVGRLLGSDLVRHASWEEAENHLLAAVRAEPDLALHRVELARIYADTRRPELAREQLDMALMHAALDPLAPLVQDEARTLLAVIDREN